MLGLMIPGTLELLIIIPTLIILFVVVFIPIWFFLKYLNREDGKASKQNQGKR